MNSKTDTPRRLLGNIAAGPPLEAVADPAGWPRLFDRPGLYALRVRGDSMVEAGIHDGDLAVIRPACAARDGQVVVALVDGSEATLKRFYCRGGEVILAPENAALVPLRYAVGRVEIQGVLHALVRLY